MKKFRAMAMTGGLLLTAAVLPAQTPWAPAAAQNFVMSEFEAQTQSGGSGGDDESRYGSGIDAINAHRYEQALANFDAVVAHGGARAEGGLYWKAYVLAKLGRSAEAQATIEKLRKSYPRSGWLEDAKALELEIRQSKGPVRPESESDEDMKILALNKLMQSEPERALPQLESLLRSSQSPKVKRQALTVIAMSGSPRARQDLEQFARHGNPYLQVAAIRYLSSLQSGPITGPLLSEVYSASSDRGVKLAVLAALLSAKDKDRLLQIANAEKNAELRGQATLDLAAAGGQAEWWQVYQSATTSEGKQAVLAAAGGQPALWQIYQSETTSEGKQAVLKAMHENGDLDKLIEVARSDKDRNVRLAAIRAVAAQKGRDASAALVSLYGSERDDQVKQFIFSALRDSGNSKALAEVESAERGGKPSAAPDPDF